MNEKRMIPYYGMGVPSTLNYILQVSFCNLFSCCSSLANYNFQLSYIIQICPVFMKVDLESDNVQVMPFNHIEDLSLL